MKFIINNNLSASVNLSNDTKFLNLYASTYEGLHYKFNYQD